MLGTTNYARLKFGLGNDFARGQQIDFVLGQWTDEQQQLLPERIGLASDAIKSFISVGLQLTMNQYNNK